MGHDGRHDGLKQGGSNKVERVEDRLGSCRDVTLGSSSLLAATGTKRHADTSQCGDGTGADGWRESISILL